MEENIPKYCFDENCRIMWVNYSEEHHKKGWSYFCFGKLNSPHRFVEKECEHINDYCYCVYTPLKGALRFFINKGDAWIYQLGMCSILNDAEPLVCDECGIINRVGSTVIHIADGVKLCPMCAVRTGIKKWDSENKKYIYKSQLLPTEDGSL
uniref:Uncharacterized protein n=1 Tax=viral metagenome TaxID=1070528 RepID=A0A6M3MBQ7_9ZZZZ